MIVPSTSATGMREGGVRTVKGSKSLKGESEFVMEEEINNIIIVIERTERGKEKKSLSSKQ